MALYAVLKFELVVQVEDQTRLDASSAYANGGDSISQVEIDAGDGNGFIDVGTSNRFLDVQYPTNGSKTIQLRLNGTETKSYTLEALSVADDNLFSSDGELEIHEPEILRYVREGRNSYLDVHRRVQTLILDWLDANRIWKDQSNRYEKADLVDIEDFRRWSAYWVLQIIFEGLSDKNDDKWMQKAQVYKELAFSSRSRGTFRLDSDGDGQIDENSELVDNWSRSLQRR